LLQKYKDDCSDATDFVEIYDGNTTSNPLLHKLCGWRTIKRLLSTKNYIHIRMVTVEEHHRGFLLNFQGYYCNNILLYES